MVDAMKGERVELGEYLRVKIESKQRIIRNRRPPPLENICAVTPIVSWWVRDWKPAGISAVTDMKGHAKGRDICED